MWNDISWQYHKPAYKFTNELNYSAEVREWEKREYFSANLNKFI